MVAQTASEATSRARAQLTCSVGMCLAYTRTWLDIAPQQASAQAAWDAAQYRHPGDRNPPRGAPVFWHGGSHGYGHIALALLPMGGPRFRGTDMPYSGNVSTAPLSWVEDNWGMTYLGWTEDLNGVAIPYLAPPSQDPWATGDVYVEKLHAGQHDSDSVARLRYRLENHDKMPAAMKPGAGNDYGSAVIAASAYWQAQVAPQINGPKDGMSWSNPQASALFGPAYTVILT